MSSAKRESRADRLRRSSDPLASLMPDLGRLSRNTSQMAFLWSVACHTLVPPEIAEFTPSMTEADFAAECRLPADLIAAGIEDAVARGLVARKGSDGLERDQFKLLRENWPSMPSVAEGAL